jgi:hypothetical protein
MKGKIKLKNDDINIDLSGEITSDDIKAINSLLQLFNQSNQINLIEKSSFSEISKDLRVNKDFVKMQDKLSEEYADYHYVKFSKLNKIIEITQDDKTINTNTKVNQKELNEKLNTLLDDLKVPNLDYVIVHTLGDLDKKEHEKVYFAIHDRLLDIPSKHIITKKNSNKVLLEVVFFGQDIVDESYFDLD